MPQVSEPTIPVKVTQGQIIVNTGWVVNQSADLIVWEFDLASKYPDGYIRHEWKDDDRDGDKEEVITVMLVTGKDTLRSDSRTTMPTMIRAEMPDGEKWQVLADWARYTVRICYYKQPELGSDKEKSMTIIDFQKEPS